MIDPTLLAEARKILADAASLGEARAMNLDPSGPVSHGKTQSQAPPWQGPSTLDELHRMLTRAAQRGPGSLRAALKDAQDYLDDARRYPFHRQPDPSHWPRLSFWWRWAIANSNRPVAELARMHTVSRTTIYAYRRAYRFDDADDDPALVA